MKRILFILAWILSFQFGFSQVGINTVSPNAQLDIKSSNQAAPANTDGILIPKIDAFPVTNPTAAQNSMLVYLTTTSAGKLPGFYYWDNASVSWLPFSKSDDDWYKVATTTAPTNINDDMFHTGNVAIGKNTTAFKLDIEETANTKNTVINATHSNPSASTKVIKTNVNSGALSAGVITSNENALVLANSVQGIGVLNSISGTTNDAVYGFRNLISTTGTSIKFGLNNSFSGAGTGSTYGTFNVFASPSATQQNGMFNSFTGTPTGASIGVSNAIEDNGHGIKIGVLDSITNGGNGDHYGIKNAFKGSGSGRRYGISSVFSGNGNGEIWGSYTSINGTGNGEIIGHYISNNRTGTGNHYGIQTSLTGNTTGAKYGVDNYISAYNAGVDPQQGVSNFITGSNAGPHTGTSNWLSGEGNGLQYGVYNYIDNSGTGTKYGIYTYVPPLTNGMHYGIYSDARKANSYSGYFVGRFSIGSTLTNNYIMPPSRGTANQIMQTDGAGNVTWQDAGNTSWSLTGNTIAAANFLGTTNNFDVVFKRFNIVSGLLNPINTSFGVNALAVTAGFNNAAFGASSLAANTTGGNNCGFGQSALSANTKGSSNFAFGYNSLGGNTTANNNIAIGANCLMGQNYSNGGTSYDTNNVAIGVAALSSNNPTSLTNGKNNVALGHFSLAANSTGYNNTASGYQSMSSNLSGNSNTAFGYEALNLSTLGSGNVALGYQAGYNETGSNKLYIENSNSATPLIYGDFSTDLLRANGNFRVKSTTVAGSEMQVKNSNLYVHSDDANLNFGTGTGYFMMSTQDSSPGNETGGIRGDGDNIAIWSPGDGGRQLRILDEDAWTDNNGNPYDNGAEVAYVAANGQYFQVSDKNKKENIQKIENPLEKITRLSGYTYQYKLLPAEIEKGQKPARSSGVLAQEVEPVMPEAVQKNESGEYFVDYAALTPLLIEALKSQNEKIKALETSNQQILKRLEQLENK